MSSTDKRGRFLLAAGVVVATMAVWFRLPPAYFVAATFVGTSVMIAATYAATGYRGLARPSARTLAVGLVSALLLYLVFYAGNAGIQALHPFGITSSSESAIYALISSPSNPLPLQVGVLLFDAVGYESFFRGALQGRMTPRLGPGAPFAAAALDAGIHLLTLNPLWVVTTFLVDLVWGLTYRYTGDLTASGTSHFVWDILIFVLLPIR